jgi:ABC-type dipeptide/oligopeptide/nickel transport system permease component
LVVQYAGFLAQVLSGNMGRSFRTHRPVLGDLLQQYPYTLVLTIASVIVSALLGTAFGVMAALRRNSMYDLGIMAVAMVWVSMPSFWLALILLIVFSVSFGWFPLVGAGNIKSLGSTLHHLVLPVAALGTRGAAVVARMTRSAVIDTLGEDYVRTARAKGLPQRRVTTRHLLRNAFAPVVSILGVDAITLIGGAVVIETVFSRPGIGRLLVNAVSARDYPLIQGAIFFIAAAVIVINLLIDVSYGLLDPRIRYD